MAKGTPKKPHRTKASTEANLGFEARLWVAADAKHAELEAQKEQDADPEDRDEYRCTGGPIAGARVKAIDFESSGHNADAQT